MEKIGRPNLNDAPGWYAYFFGLATGNDLIEILEYNKQEMLALIRAIPSRLADFSYAEGKWSIKQVFIHLADEERYYAYKAFCYSRHTDVYLEIPMGEKYAKDFNAANRTLGWDGDDFVIRTQVGDKGPASEVRYSLDRDGTLSVTSTITHSGIYDFQYTLEYDRVTP